MRFTFYFTSSELDRISERNFPDNSLLILARGIAASSLWSVMPEAALQVRLYPPEISVSGQFDPAGIARLKALVWQTKYALRTLRYVGYTDLEEDCRLLASRLNERFDRDQIRKYYFTCIPRGGLIVLGVLSYVLGLEPWQLEPPPASDATVVVVDDCALTGKRFARFLQENRHNEIIFTPLYSTPELRSAITAKESRVSACISVHDLERSEYLEQDNQYAFREIFRAPDKSDYWTGLTEYLCFAWNEPNFVFFNQVTQKVEGYWTLFPHEICLKNGPARIPVSIRPDIRTEFRVSEDVMTVQDGDSVTIDNIVTHDRYIVQGIAAEMWNILIDCGTKESLAEKLLNEYDIDQITLERDISDFIENLLSREILKVDEGDN